VPILGIGDPKKEAIISKIHLDLLLFDMNIHFLYF
jgi:hypothetical protein